MSTEINSFSEINASLYKNYNIYCVECNIIVFVINTIYLSLQIKKIFTS